MKPIFQKDRGKMEKTDLMPGNWPKIFRNIQMEGRKMKGEHSENKNKRLLHSLGNMRRMIAPLLMNKYN
jgi:hypothetical protein